MCDISSSKFRKLLQDKLLAFSQKNTNKQTKSSYQREQKHTSQAQNSQPEKKEAQQVGSDVSQGPKLYQST
jgi:stalled ribosome alternative rescue factor ArfA